jgi:uncharacterized protein
MGLLKNLFKKSDRYLPLLEASAEASRASVRELEALLGGAAPAVSLDHIVESRKRAQENGEAIDELLCQGVHAPLDRDDVELLARALGGIPRGIKKFATRYQICARRIQDVNFTPQFQMLDGAVNTVHQMVAALRSPKLAAAKAQHDVLQKIESDADKVFVALVMQLQQRRDEPIRALMLRDLYELLERVIDRCRTTGNIILRIVLKQT